jgi:hypothetical protein
MKYVTEDCNGDEISLKPEENGYIRLALALGDEDYTSRLFTLEQFKEFRKAVGYVWQDVHSDGE